MPPKNMCKKTRETFGQSSVGGIPVLCGFHAEACRTEKHVQEDKRNLRWTEFDWGYLASRIHRLLVRWMIVHFPKLCGVSSQIQKPNKVKVWQIRASRLHRSISLSHALLCVHTYIHKLLLFSAQGGLLIVQNLIDWLTDCSQNKCEQAE